MDKQEFLETLKNPIRIEILKRIKCFFDSTAYYAWDLGVDTKHIEKDGCHDLYITLSKKDYFIQVERSLMQYFTPTNGNWNVLQTNSSPLKRHTAPDGDIVYTKTYAIVEASNYTWNGQYLTQNQHV